MLSLVTFLIGCYISGLIVFFLLLPLVNVALFTKNFPHITKLRAIFFYPITLALLYLRYNENRWNKIVAIAQNK